MDVEVFEDPITVLKEKKDYYKQLHDKSVRELRRHQEAAKAHMADADYYDHCLQCYDNALSLLPAKSPAASGDKKMEKTNG